jgi:8-oxo-dGTP diphosphatase
MTKTIRIAAALIIRSDGQTLLVRKRGTTAFMQPGGKLEPGESPSSALLRELIEEIGLHVSPEDLNRLGHFEAPAANEAGFTVSADVFVIDIGDTHIASSSEIEELRWINPEKPGDILMAQLTEHHILPAYLQKRAGV